MGLDTVELVLALEEEFGVAISNAEAERIERVGDMYAFLVKAIRERDGALAASELEIWKRLKEVIVYEVGVREEEITLEARFVEDFDMD